MHNTNASVEDVLLVDLKSPNVFIHSNAIDRAILVYLNYRSAYQSWKDEIDRSNSNQLTPTGSKGNFLAVTGQPEAKRTFSGSSVNQPVPNLSKWFLNVTVTDFKVKMPLIGPDASQVLLLIIDHIGVSGIIGDITGFKGMFTGFQLKFAADGEEYSSELKMNCCEVRV